MKTGLLPGYLVLVVLGLLCPPVNAQQPSGTQCTAPIYSGKEMDRKAKILAKPEPDYDKADRRKYAGEVITLSAILCGSGEVTDIKVKSGPSDSVQAKAVEAAQKISFIPAEKDGQKVSTVLILLYRIKR